MARPAGSPTARCFLGVNGGEYPHWSVAQICDLAVRLGAEFGELSVRRVIDAGSQWLLKEIRRRRLGIHIGPATAGRAGAAVRPGRRRDPREARA